MCYFGRTAYRRDPLADHISSVHCLLVIDGYQESERKSTRERSGLVVVSYNLLIER
jgi:hypothetical protein